MTKQGEDKPKKRKTSRACVHCAKAHATCDAGRPCSRCIKKNLESTCVDNPRKKSKYLRDIPDEKLTYKSVPNYFNSNNGVLANNFYPQRPSSAQQLSDAQRKEYLQANMQNITQGQGNTNNMHGNGNNQFKPIYNQFEQQFIAASQNMAAPQHIVHKPVFQSSAIDSEYSSLSKILSRNMDSQMNRISVNILNNRSAPDLPLSLNEQNSSLDTAFQGNNNIYATEHPQENFANYVNSHSSSQHQHQQHQQSNVHHLHHQQQQRLNQHIQLQLQQQQHQQQQQQQHQQFSEFGQIGVANYFENLHSTLDRLQKEELFYNRRAEICKYLGSRGREVFNNLEIDLLKEHYPLVPIVGSKSNKGKSKKDKSSGKNAGKNKVHFSMPMAKPHSSPTLNQASQMSDHDGNVFEKNRVNTFYENNNSNGSVRTRKLSDVVPESEKLFTQKNNTFSDTRGYGNGFMNSTNKGVIVCGMNNNEQTNSTKKRKHSPESEEDTLNVLKKEETETPSNMGGVEQSINGEEEIQCRGDAKISNSHNKGNAHSLGKTSVSEQERPMRSNSIDSVAFHQKPNSAYCLEVPSENPLYSNFEWPHSLQYSTPKEIYTKVTQPYSQSEGFTALFEYLKSRFCKEDVLEMCHDLSAIRPMLIAGCIELKDEDMIFMEHCYQRTLLQYSKFINQVGTPTVVWRRSGQISYMNDEFCILTGWSREVLLGKMSFMIEILDDSSCVEYFKNFKSICFSDSTGSRNLSNLTLLSPVKDVKVECASWWTLKRDVFGLPLMIIGTFIPRDK